MTMYSLHDNINHFSRKIDTFSQRTKIQREEALFYMIVNLFLSDFIKTTEDTNRRFFFSCYRLYQKHKNISDTQYQFYAG